MVASFQKRGSVWHAQVARKGIRRSQSFASKAAAVAWATQLEGEILNGKVASDPLPATSSKTPPLTVVTTPDLGTVADLINRYVTEVKPLKRWGRTKDFSLAAIKAKIGGKAVSTLTSDTIVAYARKRAAEGAGPVTVQMDIAYLGNVLRVARSVWKLPIPRDLVPDAREALKLLGLVGKSRKRKRVAKPAELEAVKAQWASDVPTALIDFAVASSMRLSEIVSLRAEDRDGETILIRQRKHPTEKEHNDQRVPLLGDAGAILDALGAKRGRYFPFPANTVGAAWQRARDRAEIRDLRFHDLRRTGITALLKRGYPIPMVMLVSGHADFNSFKHYVGLTAEDVLAYSGGPVTQ